MIHYHLLGEFEGLFKGKKYLHRRHNLGDQVAVQLYEDLAALKPESALSQRIETGSRVRSPKNRLQGLRSRRADGTFGEIVPGETPKRMAHLSVAEARTATVEIGVEIKILAKAMLKQIERVCNDLRNQAAQLDSLGGRPIKLGIVGVNFADEYVGYEGDRSFPTTGKGGAPHPCQEADKATARLNSDARPSFDHFLILRFRATNKPPFPFAWVDRAATHRDYGSILVRVSDQYEARF